eukprot:TRINITY_DN122111_c0_g1_i1.p1 TRINITY_DN122111_c0_g1~~TRINITY_DN122111_c0_g1_i1.p1  ORF type:complete len:198 (-),score=23.56 TRINITY_DN122111_c0_g1_i1:211-804(-)
MPTAYEEQVRKELEAQERWREQHEAARAAGTLPKPSRWKLGEWGRVVEESPREPKALPCLSEKPSSWVIGPFGRPVKLKTPLPSRRHSEGQDELFDMAMSETPSRRASQASDGGSRRLATPSLHSSASLRRTSSSPNVVESTSIVKPTFYKTMSTSHASTTMKQMHTLDRSVLGEKYSPAYVVPRRSGMHYKTTAAS